MTFSVMQAPGKQQHNHITEAADVHAVDAQGVGQVLQVAISRDHRGFRHPGLRLGRVLSWKSMCHLIK